ncbi:MAG TPA: hypothetical protein VKB56_04900 [Terriglobales bacterium]|nr:hypothetical protein [Terriglobales bacterium]
MAPLPEANGTSRTPPLQPGGGVKAMLVVMARTPLVRGRLSQRGGG